MVQVRTAVDRGLGPGVGRKQVSVGRGDSLHQATRGDSSHSPFRGEKPENQKTIISIRKGRLLLVNDQGFSQIAPT